MQNPANLIFSALECEGRFASILTCVESSQYYGMVSSLFSHPMIYDVWGNLQRNDFLYISDKTGVPLLYHCQDMGTQGEVITPGNEPFLTPAYHGNVAFNWSKSLVALAKDQGGSLDFAICLLDYSSGTLQQITKGTMGRVRNVFWADNDRWIVVGNDKNTVYARTVLGDGSIENLYNTQDQISGAAYDRVRGFLVVSVGRGRGAKIGIIDVFRGKSERWITESEIPPFSDPSVFPDKGYVAYPRVSSRGTQEFVVRSIDGLEELYCYSAPGDVVFNEWLDENHLVGITRKNSLVKPRVLDIREGIWSEPLTDVSVDSLAVTQEGPIWVGTSFSVPPFIQGLREGKLVTVVPPASDRKYPTPESHSYPSFDGRKIQGWLIRNPLGGVAPLVVYCHGGPTTMAGNWWSPEIQALVSAGYHVFAPNFRGSESFGSEFRDLNIGDVGGGDLQDVLYGAKYVMKMLGLSRTPALVGGSYGGYLVLQGLTTQSDQWAGGVAVAPLTDWIDAYETGDAHYRYFCVHFLGGTPEEKKTLYAERSPKTHVGRLKRPALILAGENDSISQLEPILKFCEEAKKHGASVKLVVTKGEGHGSISHQNAIRDTVNMLEHLGSLY